MKRHGFALFSAGIAIIALLVLASGCASGPSIRTDYDRAADFSVYRTFGFADPLGTDRAGYTTLVTNRFKQSVRHQLERLGYIYDEDDPDLLVNFNTNVSRQSEVQVMPSPGLGYHSYRGSLYTAWATYDTEAFVENYEVGTVNVDVVDAKRRQLVWEGVAEGRLTEKALDDPGPVIDQVVAELFTKYPARAGGGAGNGDARGYP